MSSVSVKFSAYNIPVTVQVTPQTTFKDAFLQIKDILHLDKPMENYVIINHPFERKFSTNRIMANLKLNDGFNFVIGEKDDTEFIEKFCKRMVLPMSVESFLLPINAPLFLSKMHLMHRMIANSLDENATYEIVNIIPFDDFGEATGLDQIDCICKWFSGKYFNYIEKPKCHNCGHEVEKTEDRRPTFKEATDGAYTVWNYKCGECGAMTRFPRYLSVTKLMETHSGQSIEASVLLACILNSIGYQPRIVCNMEYDRMWIEVFVEDLNTFVHIDPIEGVLDAPYMYEQWGRKCRWIIAVGQHDCTDVTARYTKDFDKVVEERGEIFPEEVYQQIIGLRNSSWKFNADAELVEQEEERQSNDNIFDNQHELKENEKKEQTVGSE